MDEDVDDVVVDGDGIVMDNADSAGRENNEDD